MRYALVLILAIGVLGVSSCKKRRSSAKKTPEATVAAFFEAINKKRFPGDLDQFISDPKQLHTMRFRCKDRGCRRGQFKIRRAGHRTAYSAIIFVDFLVSGDSGRVSMRGSNSTFELERRGKTWLIKSIGKKAQPKPVKNPPAAAPARDAAPPNDGAPLAPKTP